jgi:hypothetical protein
MQHLQISVDVVRWPDEKLDGLFLDPATGKQVSAAQARALLREMAREGYRVVPCAECECEKDGTCTGRPRV